MAVAERLADRAAAADKPGAEGLLFDVQLASGDVDAASQTLEALEGSSASADGGADETAAAPDWARRLALEQARSNTRAWARIWVDAYEAGAELSAPDVDWAISATAPVLSRSAEAALVLFSALKAEARWTTEVAEAAERAVDVRLYGLASRGNAHQLRSELAMFEDVLGRSFVVRKHAVVLALTRDQPGALSALDELAGGDAQTIAALAFEFSSRDAHEAAIRAWEHAILSDGGRAETWFRNAAESAYAIDDVARARVLLSSSARLASEPATWSAGYDVSARAGDGTWVTGSVAARADAPCGSEDDAQWVGVAVLIQARAALADGHAVEAAERLMARVNAGCAVQELAGAGGMALADANQPGLAEPLLFEAVMRQPEALDLFAAYLSAASARAAQATPGEPTPEARAAMDSAVQRVVAPFLSEPAAQSEVSVLQLSDILREHALVASATSEDTAENPADDGRPSLDEIADAVLVARLRTNPADRDVATQYASALFTRGDDPRALATLERYVNASDDETTARVGIGRWLETRTAIADPMIPALWYAASATEVDAVAPVEGLFGMSAAAWCRFRAAELFASVGDGTSTLANVRAFLVLSPPEAAWERLTRSAVILGAMPRAEVLALTREAVASGVQTADVYIRMGRAAMGLDDTATAAVAFTDAVLTDPTRITEVVDFLNTSHANTVLVRVLRAIGDVGGRRGMLALADAYAVGARGNSERAILQRGYAERAYDTFLSSGGSLGDLNATTLSSAGLHRLAVQRALFLLEGGHDTTVSRQNSLLLDRIESGGPIDDIRRQINALEANMEHPSLVAERLYMQGFTSDAVTILEDAVNDAETSVSQHLSRVRGVVNLAAQSGDRATARRIIHEQMVLPARTLAEPYAQPPARYAELTNREEAAGDLLAAASTMFFDTGFWALAIETAEEAATLRTFTPSSILPQTLLAAIRAAGGDVQFDVVSRIVGVVGADASSWRIAASALQGLERWTLARQAWDRALALASDDWAARAQLGVVACAQGDAEAGLAAFERAVRDARMLASEDAAADTALLGAEALAEGGRRDLALALLSGAGGAARVQVALAAAELQDGQDTRALRRLDRPGLPTADVVRTLLENGYEHLALVRWQRSATAIPTRDSDALYERWHTLLLERLPLVEAAQMAHAAIGRTRSAATVDLIFARQLADAGRVDEAVQWVLPYAAELTGDDRVWLAALLAVQGADPSAALVDSPYGYMESNLEDSWIPGVLLRQGLLQAGVTPERVAPLLDRASPPWAVWNHLDRVDLEATRGEGLAALHALHTFAEGLARVRLVPTDALLDRLRQTSQHVAGAGFGVEVGELAEALAEEHDDARFLLIAAESFDTAGAEALAEAALTAFTDRVGQRSEARRWACETAWRMHHAQLSVCDDVPEILPAPEGRSWADTLMRAALARDDQTLVQLDAVRAWVRQPNAQLDLARVAEQRLDLELALTLADSPRYADDQTFLEMFERLYRAGRVDEATALIRRDLPMTTAPATNARRLQGSIDATLDPALAQALEEVMERTGTASAPLPTAIDTCSNADLWITLLEALLDSDDDQARRIMDGLHSACGETSARVDFLAALADELTPPAPTTDGAGIGALGAGSAIPLVGVREQDILTGAAIALERGRPTLAAHLAAHTLQQGTASPDARAVRAMARAQLGDADGALTDVQEWLQITANVRTGWGPLLIRSLAEAGAHEAAERVALALLRVPVSAGRLGGIASAIQAYAQGDAEAGLAFLAAHRPTVLADPVSAGLTVTIASLYSAAGDHEAAEYVYETHLRAYPEDAHALNNLAYGLSDRGVRLDEAERMVRRALAIDGPTSGAIDTLGWIQFRRGSLREASETLAMALRWAATEGRSSDSEIREHWRVVQQALAQAPAAPVRESRRERRRR